MEALRTIANDQPWRADAWKLLGDFWTRLRQYESAARAYRKAIDLDVHDDETPRKLGAIEAQLPREDRQ
jgi:cytochrome c-type biogenesis protein CcmH/NrfG